MKYHEPHKAFLRMDAVVDGDNPRVRWVAEQLTRDDPVATAERCFTFVRDEILHSVDAAREELPVSASAVLDTGSALCFGKSHLLVALWRACGLPSGFCYQRLRFDDANPDRHATHGLAAVWLPRSGWYRCDARGNTKPGIECLFTPGTESLAYMASEEGERDYLDVWAQPWRQVLGDLLGMRSVSEYLARSIDAVPPTADHLRERVRAA
ncbi:transglutaminase family protein [Acidiferrobacter sp. SPIII_3]|uniref:transglutaminase-like domain-containing protein n=1 Tax=Acidiferrobacter sp. SPIII_3 TaxID=1281578 RepID=UPI000D730A8B|nr:transglutaminase family protein [Acidiferrobacter sp. SPIII_3]AWP24719.1 transglutaminase family protein [Acidiferrobacter sp. SPIII_3]